MDFENVVSLKDFCEEVIDSFTDIYTDEKYRRDVANVLERHKAKIWPKNELSEMPNIWKGWLSDAQDKYWFEDKYRGILSITNGTLIEMRKGRGLIERAVAVHYRLHRSLDQRELELAEELDLIVFKRHCSEVFGNLFKLLSPDPSSFDGTNFSPELARLEGARWTQMAADSTDFELEAELFCHQISRRLGGRRLRYGLREAWFRVSGKNFTVLKQYRGGKMDLPNHLHYQGNDTWRVNASDGPKDNFEMLDGSLFAGAICVGKPTLDYPSELSIEVFIPKTSPKLAILGDNSDDQIDVEDWERQNLIEKMFLIYLHKRHRLDEEHIRLSSTSLPA